MNVKGRVDEEAGGEKGKTIGREEEGEGIERK